MSGVVRENPADAPPPYTARAIGRVYKRSLSGPVIFFLVIAVVLGGLQAASCFNTLSDAGETSKLKIADTVLGIFATVITAIYVFGLLSIFMKRLPLIRLYARLSLVNAVLVLVGCLLQIVFHNIFKSDWKSQCATKNSDRYDDAGLDDANKDQLEDWCQDRWRTGILTAVGWLIFLTIAAFFVWLISNAFYHQEKNPNLTRVAPSAAYQLNPYGSDQPFVPPNQPPYGYPYGASPYDQHPGGAGYGAPPPDYKRTSTGQTSAGASFMPPAYPPPGAADYAAHVSDEKRRSSGDAMEDDQVDLGTPTVAHTQESQTQQQRRDEYTL